MTAELASVFRSTVERAGLTLTVECPPLREAVYVDLDMWEKVMFNLLSNALEFTFDGAISVSVRHVDGEALVTVADTGIGIPATGIPRLFERFHRIENVLARSNEGGGIGLALGAGAHRIARRQHQRRKRRRARNHLHDPLPLGAAHLPPDAIVAERGPLSVANGAEAFLQEALRWPPSDQTSTGAGDSGISAAPQGPRAATRRVG